jgi:hypothetical protein
MILKYSALSMLATDIRDAIYNKHVFLYAQPSDIDGKGTRYILKINDSLFFRIDEKGGFILPPLNSAPADAFFTDIVELQKD